MRLLSEMGNTLTLRRKLPFVQYFKQDKHVIFCDLSYLAQRKLYFRAALVFMYNSGLSVPDF